jgi:hypothetical protein
MRPSSQSRAGCHTTPDIALIEIGVGLTPKETASSTLTFTPAYMPYPGYTDVLAAETLSDGKIALAQTPAKNPIPSRIPTADVYTVTQTK